MRRAALLLLFSVASSQEPVEGRRAIIPKDDPSPWCGTGRVWTGPLRVRVVSGKGGAPVAGIDVALETGAVRTTDANGIARFERADSYDKVRIRAVGFHAFEEYVPSEDEELLVELRPGIPVRGKVLFADGSPAAGAKAVCWDEWGIQVFDEPRMADAAGRFAIHAVERGKPIQLIVSLPGFAPVIVRRILLREEPELDLKLGGSGGIEGVVTPPADVWVRAAHKKNPLRLERLGDESYRDIIEAVTAFAHAGADGRYRVEGLEVPGTYVVCAGPCESAVIELSAERPRATVAIASTAGPPRSIRILDESGDPLAKEWVGLLGPTGVESAGQTSTDGALDLPPGEWQVDVDGYLLAPAAPEVKLNKGITMRGVVVDPDGKPVPQTHVFLAQPLPGGGYRAQTVTSDASGRFEISGNVAGEGWLTAGSEPEGPHGPDDGRIRIRAGMEEMRLEIPWPKVPEPRSGEADLKGVVEDESGRPVGGATVDIGYPYKQACTDEKGAFTMVRPVTPTLLEVAAPGFATRYVPLGKPGTETVRVVLGRGALVRGRVVGATGMAVPGAYIVFWRRLESGRLSPYEDWKPETDSVGRFEIRLPPGTYHARFYDMAFSHARIPGPDVAVQAGETMDLEIRLP
jgi:protocatechuate 3,4-dioxygenase beta subunit